MTTLARRLLRNSSRPPIARFALIGAGIGALTALLVATRVDKRRRQIIRARAAAKLHHKQREYDDITLAHLVEGAISRTAHEAKGHVSVNAHYGIVELRGQVDDAEDIEALGDAAAHVDGVREVHNLLHTPGSPAKHSPPSDPKDVRRRAREAHPVSGFTRTRRRPSD